MKAGPFIKAGDDFFVRTPGMTDITLEDRKAFCQLGSGFTVACGRKRPL
jgi:hypothetical protein